MIFFVPNFNPTVLFLPSDLTVTEDAQSNLNFSTAEFSDPNSASIIKVTLTASAGTFAVPADGSGVGGGVSAVRDSSGNITLTGAPDDINTYLDTASNIQYTSASNVSGMAAATIEVTADDGDGSGNVFLGTVNINVTGVNDNPEVAGLPTAVTVIEDTPGDVNLSTVEFSDIDSASITVTLTPGAGIFGVPADGSGVGVTAVRDGSGNITLTGAPGDINTYLDTASNIQYTSASNVSGPAAATIVVTANDGDGSGNISMGTINVNVTGVTDAPVLTGTGGNPTFTENGPAQDLFNSVTASTIELGDRIIAMSLTVTNVADGADEVLSIDGTDIALVAGTTVGTAINNLTVDVTRNGTTAEISFSSANLTSAQLQTLVDGLTYENRSEAPTTLGNRIVTITGLQDSGGTENGGADTSAPNLTSAVTITATNDAPSINGFGLQDIEPYVHGVAFYLNPDGLADIVDPELDAANGGTGNYSGANITLEASGGSSNSHEFYSLGQLLDVVGTHLVFNGLTFGTVIDNTRGSEDRVVIELNENATSALVDAFFQGLGYVHTDTTHQLGVDLFVSIEDNNGSGSAVDQGSGASLLDSARFELALGSRPILSNLDGDAATFLEGGGPVHLEQDGNVTVSDVDGVADLNGATLTVSITSGGNPLQDLLSFADVNGVTLSGTSSGATLNHEGVTIGTLASDISVGNSLQFTLTGLVDFNLVSSIIQGVTYTNTSDDPSTEDREVSFRLLDERGFSNEAVTTTVSITPVNDAPTVTSSPVTATFTEGDAAIALFSGTSVSTIEDGQSLTASSIQVLNVSDGADEILIVDGTEIALVDGFSATTSTLGLTATVTVTGTTATIALSGVSVTPSQMASMIDSMTYENRSDVPTTNLAREIRVPVVTDDGGIANSGQDTSTPSVSAQITLAGVNDAATITGLDGATTVAAGRFSVLDPNVTLSDPEADAENNGAGNYSGFTVIVRRTDRLDNVDRLILDLAGNMTFVAGQLSVNGDVIANVRGGDGTGPLSIEFTDTSGTAPSRAMVNAILQGISYSNTVEPVGTSAQFEWLIVDEQSGRVETLQAMTVELVAPPPVAPPPPPPAPDQGTSQDDTLDGTTNADSIFGLDGSDTITSGAGDDFVDGGTGQDIVRLGAGNDTYVDSTETGVDAQDIVRGGTGADTIHGGGGGDTIFGGPGHDLLQGGRGADDLNGGRGDDAIFGGAGDDIVRGGRGADDIRGGLGNDAILGGRGADNINGGRGADTISAGVGRDTIFGGLGNDDISAGPGADQVDGGGGNDRINGGKGSDILSGGAGRDTFIFTAVAAIDGQTDRVLDFELGADTLELRGFTFSDLSISDGPNGAEIMVDGFTIVLDGIQAVDLSETEFVFL